MIRGGGGDRDRAKTFPCSADHEQYRGPYPVDPFSAESVDHTNKDTYISPFSPFNLV